MNSTLKLRSAVIVFALVGVLNIEGLLKLLVWSDISSGQLNPYLGPLVLLVLGLLYFHQSFSNYLKDQSRRSNKVFLLTLLTTAVMVTFGISSGEWLKLSRDIIYLWIMSLTYLNLRAYGIDKSFDIRFAVKWLLALNIVILPSIAILLLRDMTTGRFASFMLSEPVFAIVTALIMSMAFYCRLNFWWLVIGTAFSTGWIVLSGTRTALILLAATVGYVALIGYGKQKHLWPKVFAFLGVGVLLGLYSDVLFDAVENMSGLRVLNYSDTEYGSLHTRFSWYSMLFEHLVRESVIGGFGAGASESSIGYLTHFDFLRYWYDYSLFYLLMFLAFPVRILLELRNAGNNRSNPLVDATLFTMSAVMLVLVSMHNIFQSPGGTIVLTTMLFLTYYGFLQRSDTALTPEDAPSLVLTPPSSLRA
jgi:hypothetical protein